MGDLFVQGINDTTLCAESLHYHGDDSYLFVNATITYIFIGLFSVLLFFGIVCSCVFAYFKWIKGKKLFKNKYTDY